MEFRLCISWHIFTITVWNFVLSSCYPKLERLTLFPSRLLLKCYRKFPFPKRSLLALNVPQHNNRACCRQTFQHFASQTPRQWSFFARLISIYWNVAVATASWPSSSSFCVILWYPKFLKLYLVIKLCKFYFRSYWTDQGTATFAVYSHNYLINPLDWKISFMGRNIPLSRPPRLIYVLNRPSATSFISFNAP